MLRGNSDVISNEAHFSTIQTARGRGWYHDTSWIKVFKTLICDDVMLMTLSAIPSFDNAR